MRRKITSEEWMQRATVAAQIIADGGTRRDVADALQVNEENCKMQLKRIYDQLGVDNQVGLVVWAFRKGLIR